MTLAPALNQPQPTPPPAPPGIFARTWPAPEQPATPPALLGAALAGLAAAVALVVSRVGIGWVLTGLVVAGTAVVTAWWAGQRRPTPAQLGWGLAALALLSTGAFRAAGWLFVFCVVGALLAGSLALAGGRTAYGLWLGMTAGLLAGARALPWAATGLAGVRPDRRPGSPRLGLAVLVAIGLVTIFGALLASADPVFARLVSGWTPPSSPADLIAAGLRGLLVLVIALGAAFLAARRPAFDEVPPTTSWSVRRVEWAVPLAALDLLFLTFVLVQLTVLFGGQHDNLDYARYARSGFFQLVWVTLLTLVVLGVAARVAPRRERADRLLLRVLLGTLAVLTLVIVASALRRMALYEQAYGWTRLRILVGAVELWLGLLFVLVLAAGVRLRGAWLPRAVAGTAVVGLLAVTLLSPDRFIADRNVDRYFRTGDIDRWYLLELSPDAAPALDRLPPLLRSCALAQIAADLADEPDDWRTWNLGRAQARAVIARGPQPNYRLC